jgi:hypothetical protein
MSKMERAPVLGSTKVAVYDPGEIRATDDALPPLVEKLVVGALFTGWIGFWIAVIWWLVR